MAGARHSGALTCALPLKISESSDTKMRVIPYTLFENFRIVS